MKVFFLITLLLFLMEGLPVRAEGSGDIASVELPIRTSIINLALLPVTEAITFCDDHNMPCPVLRQKHDEEKNLLAQDEEKGFRVSLLRNLTE